IRLQRADEMHPECVQSTRELCDKRLLLLPLLYAVLSEEPQAGRPCLRDRFRGMHLTDRHQSNISFGAAAPAARVCNLLLYAGRVRCDRHATSILWGFRRKLDGCTCVANRTADWIECFYDLRMVWAPQVQRGVLV